MQTLQLIKWWCGFRPRPGSQHGNNVTRNLSAELVLIHVTASQLSRRHVCVILLRMSWTGISTTSSSLTPTYSLYFFLQWKWAVCVVKPWSSLGKRKTLWETPSSLSLGAAAPNGRNLLVQESVTAVAGRGGRTWVSTVIMLDETNTLFSLFVFLHLWIQLNPRNSIHNYSRTVNQHLVMTVCSRASALSLCLSCMLLCVDPYVRPLHR